MKILMLLNPWKDLDSQIDFALENGFDGIEIVLEDDTKNIFLNNPKEFLKKLKFTHVFHLDHSYNIFREKDYEELKNILKHIDSFSVLHLNAEKQQFDEFIERVEKLKSRYILIENLAHSMEDLEYFLEISNLNLTFDLSHAFSFNTESKVLNFLNKNLDRIMHFHISDCIYFTHSHFPFGYGILPLKKIVEFLKRKNTTVTIELIDSQIPEIDYPISLNILKNL
ncbi:MAG: TIM barrel protein [Candidatus Aenigmatarchaeota archaeon]